MIARDTRRAAFCLAVACSALGACGGEPVTGLPTHLHGCAEVLPPATCVDVPSFARDVKPILDRSCASCHYDSPAPNSLWPLTDYGDVAAWNDLVKTSLLRCSQPPASSVFPFSEEDRETILKWTLCNHPP
jgi:hypothetical protein